MKRAANLLVALRRVLASNLSANGRLVLTALVVYAGVPPGRRTVPELATDTALSPPAVCVALGELVGASLAEYGGEDVYSAASELISAIPGEALPRSLEEPAPAVSAVRQRPGR